MNIKHEKGSALVMVMIFTLVLTILGTAMLGITINEYKMNKAFNDSVRAYYLAEAGAEKAIYSITQMESITTGGLLSRKWEMGEEDSDLLKDGTQGNYTVSVQDANLVDVIYIDEEETEVYKTIFEVILKSIATVEGMKKELEIKARIEDYEEDDIDDKVEINYWRQVN